MGSGLWQEVVGRLTLLIINPLSPLWSQRAVRMAQPSSNPLGLSTALSKKLKLPTSVYLAPHHHPLPAPPLPLPHFQLLAQAARTACSSQTPPPFFPCICQMLACSRFLQILAWLIPTNFSGLSRNGAFTMRLMKLKLQGL